MFSENSVWLHSIWVGLGGFFGAISRYAVGQLFAKRFPSIFPYGTLFINVLGSFLLGGLVGEGLASSTAGFLLGIGFMGAFTTFSTLAYESLQLGKQQNWLLMGVYLGISCTLGIVFAFLGYYVL